MTMLRAIQHWWFNLRFSVAAPLVDLAAGLAYGFVQSLRWMAYVLFVMSLIGSIVVVAIDIVK